MSLPVLENDRRSTLAAAEALAALATGDTPRAKEKYGEAGRLLETKIASARQQSEKHLIRFLAATQYFLGGRYQEAIQLSRRIEQRLLPEEIRPLFPKFFQDVKARTSTDYEKRTRAEFLRLLMRGDYADVLERLQEHPYLFPPGKLAFLRGAACENLGYLPAAAQFFADAIRLCPNEPWIRSTAAALPLTLPGQGKLDEAWKYVQQLVEAMPHPITGMIASVVCLHRAATAPSEERVRIIEEQYLFFEKARLEFEKLPETQRGFHDFREIMKLGFGAMDNSLQRLGDLVRARVVCDQAIAFQPGWGEAWERRGAVRYPDPEAVGDFTKAIELGDDRYFPYFFLAHHALTKNDFGSAVSWIEQALGARKKPGKRVQAQLHSWLAICKDLLGANREVVQAHFDRALEIDPNHELVKESYRVFLDSTATSSPQCAPNWFMTDLQRDEFDLSIFDRQDRLAEAIRRTNSIQRELQEA